MSILRKEDEEFQMLLEVAKNVTEQFTYDVKKGEKTKPHKTSGEITEAVIREHLIQHGVNVSENRRYVNGSDREIDLLVLNNRVDPNKEHYSPSEVHTVLEIRNNAVGSEDRNPNKVIRKRFDNIESDAKVNRFAVVVLSEKLLSGKLYKWRIGEEEIGKPNCRVFTLIARKQYPQGKLRLYFVDVIMEMLHREEMRRTGDWNRLLDYLKS